jgi:alpha-tubulin suppressor-like RCC1 family protein
MPGLLAALLVLAVALGMVPVGASPAFADGAGADPSPAAAPAGSGLAWGSNGAGQLGNGTDTDSNVPVPVALPAGTTITAIAGGRTYSLALTSTGTVLAWGSNNDGQLGNPAFTRSSVPVPVRLPAGTTITGIAAGGDHSLAVTSTGTVLAWGSNSAGQVGNGNYRDQLAPVRVNLPAGTTITAIAAGTVHSLAVTSTGTGLAWGSNRVGQLGNGTNTDRNRPVPVNLPAGTTITAIAAGVDHSLAVTSTGTALAWGNNEFGELGNGSDTNSNLPVPVNLPAGTTITAIAAGSYHSLAVTTTGTVLAWGNNSAGQVGNGSNTNSNLPIPVNLPAGTTITAIAAGFQHSLAIAPPTSTTTLPVTGVNLPATLAAGVLLLLAGAALVLTAHRRRSAHRTTA